MTLNGRQVLDAFTRTHSDARNWINNWIADVERATWQTPHDLKAVYPKTSILPRNTFIFDVRGNEYRLEVTISFNVQVVKAVWAGTHAAYDKRNKARQ